MFVFTCQVIQNTFYCVSVSFYCVSYIKTEKKRGNLNITTVFQLLCRIKWQILS